MASKKKNSYPEPVIIHLVNNSGKSLGKVNGYPIAKNLYGCKYQNQNWLLEPYDGEILEGA